jgi:hypothetical protein
MCGRIIAVGLNTSSQPTGGFGICTEMHLGCSHKIHPLVGKRIARGETESLKYVTFGLGRATHMNFG